MSEHALFYNDENGDREYDADDFGMWLRKFFTNGVFEGEMQVTSEGGMVVAVQAGTAYVGGKTKDFAYTEFTVPAPNSIYPRIDTMVMERNDTDRDFTLKLVTGQYSSSTPSPTAPVRGDGVYQLVLAQIYVGAGATGITQADITDTRTNTSLCGYVVQAVDEVDFSQFTRQFNAYYEQFKANNLRDFEDWMDDSETAWDAWFDHMKDQLDSDAAGHLQNEVDAIVDYSQSTDQSPYQFRRCTHNAVYDKLVGISYAKNQLVQNGNFASTNNWVAYTSALSVSNNVANVVVSSSAQDGSIYQSIQGIGGHKYLVMADIRSDGTNTASLRADGFGNNFKLDTTSSSFSTLSNVISLSSARTFRVLASGYAPSMTFQVKNFMCIDLTLMFSNPAIADKIYAMEQAEAGSGLAWIRQYGFLNDTYIEYNAGAIESSAPTYRKVVGKNLYVGSPRFDGYTNIESWTYDGTLNGYPVIAKNVNYNGAYKPLYLHEGSYTFSFMAKADSGVTGVFALLITDTAEQAKTNINNKSIAITTTWNKYSVAFTVQKAGNVCLRVQKSSGSGNIYISQYQLEFGENSTDFEPYKEVTYPLGGDTLQGVPKLVGDDLVADGDIKTSDGVVNSRYALIDLGTKNYTRSTDYDNPFFHTIIDDRKKGDVDGLCSKYTIYPASSASEFGANAPNKSLCFSKSATSTQFFIRDDDYTDVASLKAALSGQYLLYPLATPTSSVSTPFTSPQVSLATEETDTICGHDSVVVDIPEWMQNQYFDDVRADASRVHGVEQNVSDLQTNMQGVEQNVSDLQTALGGKKIVVCPEAQRGSDANTLYFCY